jgi:hypothetical protein
MESKMTRRAKSQGGAAAAKDEAHSLEALNRLLLYAKREVMILKRPLAAELIDFAIMMLRERPSRHAGVRARTRKRASASEH